MATVSLHFFFFFFSPSLLCFVLLSGVSFAADPFVSYDFKVSYLTASPLGVPQQVIAVNGQFPGPLLNATTNYNVVVRVFNNLDESLLLTWSGIQMRRNSWQDGVLGTNCPIPAGWNFTYQFQVKDQIGSFFYSPSLNFQRASGGFGPVVVNNRNIIPIPFPQPDGEIIFMIGDWYTQDHKALRRILDSGKELGMPDGVLINGKGPYKYNSSVPDGIDYLTAHVEPGKTYRIRVHNVGISTSLNFRIQNHNLLLVETDGHYTSQTNFTDFDIHVGQSYSFLVTMDQNATSDYYIVASARFVNETVWQRVTGVAILHYSNSNGPASGPLPVPKTDVSAPWSAMTQPRAIRQNTSASGARPNPQGSFHYGQINITNTYILRSLPPTTINGSLRATLNGISFVNPRTPVRLADHYKVKGAYKLDFPDRPFDRPPRLDTSLINATYKGFIQVVFQNNDTKMQSFHVDGYTFFVVGMDFGVWSEDKKGSYNNYDAISRSTIEVYPGGWTAGLISLDNVGVWNIRVENLDRWYLGEETYMRIINPEENGQTEMDPPDNVLYCGALGNMQKKQHHSAATSIILNGHLKLMFSMLMALVFIFC
ncbi:Monocopper oxidase-like protein SKS1 [Raphanus sativus]|uniref:Monocopper oxidase-like protein SKS1 n=1 Tax=Raphanus sativus TaxID=3726 RepID=A0A6J0KFH7_RAPSA|nr:monocopper oxidase-like protein SKS1 [Raphanus sativus]KAJ4913141.1 Monocopper oxidase-like protein SKS1 [Raphanus sativus]